MGKLIVHVQPTIYSVVSFICIQLFVVDRGYIFLGWILYILVIAKSAYKPSQNLYYNHEIHKNWYFKNNNAATVNLILYLEIMTFTKKLNHN